MGVVDMCAWTGGIYGGGSKPEAWLGARWEVVRHGCGGLSSWWEEGQGRLGADRGQAPNQSPEDDAQDELLLIFEAQWPTHLHYCH